jgi:hypothetical protein
LNYHNNNTEIDVTDCTIEQWDSYSDDLKKQWVIKLIQDKRSLQLEVIELQQQINNTKN